MSALPKVVVVEFGCQYTLLIQQRLMELGVRAAVLDPKQASLFFQKNPVQAVILSGGEASVYDEGAPKLPAGLFDLRHEGQAVPILSICYGMQAVAQEFGGTVEPSQKDREYGYTKIVVLHDPDPLLFRQTPSTQGVWASHGDTVTKLPDGFELTAISFSNAPAGMVHRQRRIWGVQFHPEVHHTEHGRSILDNFIFGIAGCERDWQPSDMIEDIRRSSLDQLGGNHALLGFSGGVDSTTEAAILSAVLDERLLGVTLDGGNLRENEAAEIERHAMASRLPWRYVAAHQEFSLVAETTDAEEKRARFKQVYARLLMREAERFGGNKVTLVQGTLAPDRIESGKTGGALIKSHHNVGLDTRNLPQIHPLGHLFKYEVRKLAQALGLPQSVWKRQPFPGPGNFIRVVGIPATVERMQLVAWAYARTKEILERHRLDEDTTYYDAVSQLVVGLVGVNTVGVKGSSRAYGPSIVVRAIKTIDFMTGDGFRFPNQVKDEIEATLCRHRDIIRVWYDEMDKPPATTELE